MWGVLTGLSGPSRQAVSHGSGLSRQVSLYCLRLGFELQLFRGNQPLTSLLSIPWKVDYLVTLAIHYSVFFFVFFFFFGGGGLNGLGVGLACLLNVQQLKGSVFHFACHSHMVLHIFFSVIVLNACYVSVQFYVVQSCLTLCNY